MADVRFPRRFDPELSPKERGKLAAGRGESLPDCPYTDPKDVEAWQDGWRAKQRSIRRLSNAITDL